MSPFRDSRKNVYINKYLDHLSFITKFAPAEKKHSCDACSASFRDVYNFNKHFKTLCEKAPINRLIKQKTACFRNRIT